MDQKIRQKHTTYLARPFKRKTTRKFQHEDSHLKLRYFYLKRPLESLKNRRLEMLAKPKRFTPKYEEPEVASTCVSRAVLEVMCTPRLDHLSRPLVRCLEAMRNERTHLGKQFIDTMNERIAMSLDTIYYHNIKSLMILKESHKGSKTVAKKPKLFEECGDKERLIVLATPKVGAKPRKPPKRKWKKIELLKPRIDKLSVPLHFYRRPSQDTLILRLKIKPSTLNYVPTERIRKLTEMPAWRLVKPYLPVGVKPGALLYEITERTQQLAVPHPRAHAVESDLKENPYDISPFALKYKATPRIIELAKPIER